MDFIELTELAPTVVLVLVMVVIQPASSLVLVLASFPTKLILAPEVRVNAEEYKLIVVNEESPPPTNTSLTTRIMPFLLYSLEPASLFKVK